MGVPQPFPSLRPREPRIKTFIPARMRLGARWTDVFILNLSSRGCQIRSSEPVDRGTYVELRRGDQAIVARVVWQSGSRAGLRTQDRVPVEAIVTSAAGKSDRPEGPPAIERRERPRGRIAQAHERSRLRGRAWEFAGVAVVGATLSIAVVSLVAEVLAQPLAKVGVALSGQASLPSDSR